MDTRADKAIGDIMVKKQGDGEVKEKKSCSKFRNIGIPVKTVPSEDCKDERCPFHGHLKVRGRVFEGKVISADMKNGATIEWKYLKPVPKYDRYERRKSKTVAHNPGCIHAKEGDIVRIAECRPLSKTKKFVIIEKLTPKG